MIDYQTFCRLRQLYDEKGLKISQIAIELQLDPKTVEKWVDHPTFQARQGTKRPSKLDSFKGQIPEARTTGSGPVRGEGNLSESTRPGPGAV